MPLLGGFGIGGGSPQVQVALEETGSTPPPGQPTGHGLEFSPQGAAASSGVGHCGILLCPSEVPVNIQTGEPREEYLTDCLTGEVSWPEPVGSLSGDQHPVFPGHTPVPGARLLFFSLMKLFAFVLHATRMK